MKALKFTGSGFEYFKIWIVNILLTVVTLGLYYPWAKVRKHRYFYANSTLEERNFEYHATGKQLFIGYLIAMGVFIAYVGIQSVSPIGSLVVLLLFIIALPWIIWRSLMFNMRVTSFSNVRFSFDGALGGAYINYLVLPICAFIAVYLLPIFAAVVLPGFSGSIGVASSIFIGLGVVIFIFIAIGAIAYLKKRNTTYTISGFKYGQGAFSTNLETIEFVIILFKALCLSILIFVLALIAIALVASTTGMFETLLAVSDKMNDPDAMAEVMQNSGIFMLIALLYLVLIFASLLVFAYSHSRQRAYVFASTKLDEQIDFSSSLRARSLAWVSVTNLLAIIFTLGLAVPWAAVRMARLMLENTQVDTSLGFDDYVTQKQQEQSALGEQLGDAFDVDVGLGF